MRWGFGDVKLLTCLPSFASRSDSPLAPEDTEYVVLAKHQHMGAINTYRSFVW